MRSELIIERRKIPRSIRDKTLTISRNYNTSLDAINRGWRGYCVVDSLTGLVLFGPATRTACDEFIKIREKLQKEMFPDLLVDGDQGDEQ